MWTVTRQQQYPDGDLVVEISKGDYDYVNPGALMEKYEGEGETFVSAVKAVEVAIAIQTQWQQDSPDEEILIAMGATMGMTMPFDPEDPEDLLEKAEAIDAEAKHCDQCGEIIPDGNGYSAYDVFGDALDGEYCSEYCCDRAHEYDAAFQLEIFLEEAKALCEERDIDWDEISDMVEDRFPRMGSDQAIKEALEALYESESQAVEFA
jgi:hypothetical protein